MRKFKQEIIDEREFQFAVVPPNNLELEKAVLGAIMLEKNAFETVYEIIKPECFYNGHNQKIYSAIINLAKTNQPIDLLTVVHMLTTTGDLNDLLTPYYVSTLTNSVVSAANIENHCRILLMLSQRREMIVINGMSMNDARDETKSIDEIFQAHDIAFTRIQNTGARDNVCSSEKVVQGEISALAELRKRDSHITGIPSGFSSLDRVTHGFQNSDLIVIAARPSIGKTALALRLLRNAVENHHNQVSAIFFTLEMSSGQLAKRLLSSESGVFLKNIVSGNVSNDEMDKVIYAGEKLSKLSIFFDDTPSIGIMEMKTKIRRQKRKHNIGIVFVDYMQLMSGDARSGNREQEISSISRNLKSLAKELNIPVVALCQLSREVEKRSDKTPQLSDLRESGAIEQDADLVAFLYKTDEEENSGSNSSLTAFKIAKHRNGALETIKLRADLSIQKFYEYGDTLKSVAPKGFKPITMAFENSDETPF